MTSVGSPTTTTPFDPGAAAAFLDKHAPETLQGLRREEDAEAVITLGAQPPPSTGLFTPARWRAMAREREEALEQGIRLCNAKIAELRPGLGFRALAACNRRVSCTRSCLDFWSPQSRFS